MTFAALSNKLRLKVDYPIDKIQLFREAEDDFIEQTWCVETFNETSVGTTSNLVDVPTRMVKLWRITWDGCPLEPLPQGTRLSIYNSSDNPYTGTPRNYWIEDEQIHLIPQPATAGYLRTWATCYNATDATSPIIPVIEQNKLINWVMATLLEMDGEEKRAQYYWNKYNNAVLDAKIKYLNERFRSGQDTFDTELTGYIGSSTVLNEYVWKKVQFTGTTEQVFITGTSPLALTELDSGQTVLPTFTTPVKVEVTASYQDRDAYVSTDPTISNGCVTFGLTRSEFGAAGETCYYDISVYQLNS